MKLVIVTGMSGAGKTIALKMLEMCIRDRAMLAATLILVKAMAANGEDLFDQTENSNVSAVVQYQR